MREIFAVIVFLSVQNLLFADFWKELNKVVNVLEELAAPTVSNLCICEDVSEGRPVSVSTAFPKNVRKLHVWFNIYGAGPDVTISSLWMRDDGTQFRKIQELSKNGPSDQGQAWMDFSLAVTEGSNWPSGNYKVDIVWNNKVLGSVQFQITDALKGGEGIWQGTKGTDGMFPANSQAPALQSAPSPAVPVARGVDLSILTEDEKYMIRNLTEQEIELMIGSKIHGIVSEYGSISYKWRNEPAKIAKFKAEAQERISKVQRWGNAALAIKNLPPKWNPDEPYPLDPEDGRTRQQTTPQKKVKDEDVDFSF